MRRSRFSPGLINLARLGAFVLALPALSAVHGAELALCTARADGNYYAAGEAIRSRTNPDRLQMTLVETAGSVDNLERLARGECDAAIVQLDAYLVYQDAHEGARLALARPSYLYEEFVHLVCRRDSNIDDIEDLADAADAAILVGAPDSGSAATWQSFTQLDPSYRRVEARPVGGMEALAEIGEPGGPACMMFVSGLRSAYSAAVGEHGESLRLVTVSDSDLDEARFGGERIYQFREIPAGTYPALQGNGKSREVETLTVGATLFVTERWAAENVDAHTHLVDAIQRAKPTIASKVAPN